MDNYFEVGVRYQKQAEDGTLKNVTELYLVEAMSFTEAEARITEEMKPYISGDYRVVKEKITNISEVVTTSDDNADKFYKVKHSIITIDEKTGKEKKSPQYLLFQASSNDDARNRYNAYMKGLTFDAELEAISDTKLLDYFPYKH